MQLHTLRPQHPLKNRKPRIGRGGKRGTTSGRGQKGQKAHAGRRIPTGLKDIFQRLPKLRGVNNKPKSIKPQIVDIQRLVEMNEKTVNKDMLLKRGLIRDKHKAVKILGNGQISKPIILNGLLVSKSVRSKIESAGGRIK